MTVIPLPPSIDGTGKADATTGLTNFFRTIPDGIEGDPTRVALGTDATYRVDGIFTITDRHYIDIIPQGAQLQRQTLAATKNAPVLNVVGGTHLGVGLARDPLNIDGGHAGAGLNEGAYDPDVEGQHGLKVDGTDDSTFNMNIHHTRADLAYFGKRKIGSASAGQKSYHWATNCVLTGRFWYSGRQGLTLAGVKCFLLINYDFRYTRRSTWDFEPLYTPAMPPYGTNTAWNGTQGFWAINGHVGPGRLNWLTSSGTGPVNDIHVIDMTADRPLDVYVANGETGKGRRDTYEFGRIKSTALSGNGERATMRFHRVDHVHIYDIEQRMDLRDEGKEMALASFEDCTDYKVDGHIDLGTYPNAGPILGAAT